MTSPKTSRFNFRTLVELSLVGLTALTISAASTTWAHGWEQAESARVNQHREQHEAAGWVANVHDAEHVEAAADAEATRLSAHERANAEINERQVAAHELGAVADWHAISDTHNEVVAIHTLDVA